MANMQTSPASSAPPEPDVRSPRAGVYFVRRRQHSGKFGKAEAKRFLALMGILLAAVAAIPLGPFVVAGLLAGLMLALLVVLRISHRAFVRFVCSEIRNRVSAAGIESDRGAAIADVFTERDWPRFMNASIGVNAQDREILRQLSASSPSGTVYVLTRELDDVSLDPPANPFEPIALRDWDRLRDVFGVEVDVAARMPLGLLLSGSPKQPKWSRAIERRFIVWMLPAIFTFYGVWGMLEVYYTVRGASPGRLLFAAIALAPVVIAMTWLWSASTWHVIPGGMAQNRTGWFGRGEITGFRRDDSILVVSQRAITFWRRDGLTRSCLLTVPQMQAVIRAWLCDAESPSDEHLAAWFGQ